MRRKALQIQDLWRFMDFEGHLIDEASRRPGPAKRSERPVSAHWLVPRKDLARTVAEGGITNYIPMR